ncbi:hypothetical protein, partial [Endozoicomonas arenosclerae]|uniref:hypothetical protein n=1 Tax=Endozoicomonas arenosclerae TaxID=1633495 RepID=UPI000AC8A225
LSWTVESKGLHYLFDFLTMLIMVCSISFFEKKKYFNFCLCFLLIVFSSVLLGIKGALINLIILLMAVSVRGGVGWKIIFQAVVLTFIFLVLTLYLFFGGLSLEALNAIISRVIATIDGTYIILSTGIDESYQLPNNILVYIFDFIVSKFNGVIESLGQ